MAVVMQMLLVLRDTPCAMQICLIPLTCMHSAVLPRFPEKKSFLIWKSREMGSINCFAIWLWRRAHPQIQDNDRVLWARQQDGQMLCGSNCLLACYLKEEQQPWSQKKLLLSSKLPMCLMDSEHIPFLSTRRLCPSADVESTDVHRHRPEHHLSNTFLLPSVRTEAMIGNNNSSLCNPLKAEGHFWLRRPCMFWEWEGGRGGGGREEGGREDAKHIATACSSCVLRAEFNKHGVLENTAWKASHCSATCSVLRGINAIADNLCDGAALAC